MDNSKFIKEHECPACGGSLVFVPEKGKLVCEFCDSEFDIEEEKEEEAAGAADEHTEDAAADTPKEEKKPEIEGFDFSKFYESAKMESGDKLPIYSCKSCGAEVIAAGEEASLTCPYCTNKIVLTDKVSGSLRPDGVIPFRIPKKELKAHLDEFYKDKKLLPKDFFSESKMEKVTGVYVPFFLFTGKLSGLYKYTCHKSSSSTEGEYNVTTTKNYHVERNAEAGFTDIPIDASDKLDDSLMDSVLPYDLSELKKFSPDYLAGFTADRFDVPGKELQTRADNLMKNTLRSMVVSALNSEYSSISYKSSKLQMSETAVKYVLLPVYIFSIRLKKKAYHFAVNGQTGKVVGELPTDKTVSRNYFLLRFGITAGAILLAFILSYLMGGAM